MYIACVNTYPHIREAWMAWEVHLWEGLITMGGSQSKWVSYFLSWLLASGLRPANEPAGVCREQKVCWGTYHTPTYPHSHRGRDAIIRGNLIFICFTAQICCEDPCIRMKICSVSMPSLWCPVPHPGVPAMEEPFLASLPHKADALPRVRAASVGGQEEAY